MLPDDRREDIMDVNSYAAVFSSGLLDPDHATPAAVAGPNGKRARMRYNVYRNNVTVSLIEALAAVFPATMRITGRDFFRAMARSHIRATPPTSPLLFEYGRAFPDFIEGYEFARQMPWLADVARIERAWLDAYHAADAEPLSPLALASIPRGAVGRNGPDGASCDANRALGICCGHNLRRKPRRSPGWTDRSDRTGECAGDATRPGGRRPKRPIGWRHLPDVSR